MPTLGHISSERHYMGTSSNGRYSTRATRTPDRLHVRTADESRLIDACAPAWQTRYYRSLNVVGMVLDCHDAKDEVAALEVQIYKLKQARAQELSQDKAASLTAKIARLEREYNDALAYRQEASRQLRQIGISPLAEARILEIARRQQASASA